MHLARLGLRPLLVAAAALAAVLVLVLNLGSFGNNHQAKAAGGINISGPVDVLVDLGLPADAYHCIANLVDDGTNNPVNVTLTAVCNDNGGGLGAGGGLPQQYDGPGEGVTNGGLNASCRSSLPLDANGCNGPPPPPPYTSTAPGKGSGHYDRKLDQLTVYSCFRYSGAPSAPALVTKLSDGTAGDLSPTTTGPATAWATGAKSSSSVKLYARASLTDCANAETGGAAPAVGAGSGELTTETFRTNDATGTAICGGPCTTAPWRTGSQTDWDGDGCTDAQELAVGGPPAGCGDDPWSPLDASGANPSIAGPYDIIATVTEADCSAQCGSDYVAANCAPNPAPCPLAGFTITPGLYYSCIADLQQGAYSGSSAPVTGRALCYIDSNVLTNNKPANGTSCPPANAKFCSDGYAGAPQPGCAQQYQGAYPGTDCLKLPANPPSRHDCAGLGTSPDPSIACDMSQWNLTHVDKIASLTGTVQGTGGTSQIHLTGCFPDPNGKQVLGAVYVDTTIDTYTGHGTVSIYSAQPDPNCVGSPSGSPGSASISIVRQPPGSKTFGGGSVLCDGGSGHPQPMPGTTNKCRNTDSNGTCFDPTNVATTYCRDSDGDGCFDKDELDNNEGTQTALDAAKYGGLRDPQNPYDYPDMPIPSNKHKIRVDDVTYVVNRFRHDMNLLPAPGSNPYDPKADHTVIAGNNAGETWHLGVPNGQIRVDDVTAVVNSFRHDCN